MSDVIDFEEYRKQKTIKSKRVEQDSKYLLDSAVDIAVVEWESNMQNGSMNQKISELFEIEEQDFMHDLNAIGNIERSLNLATVTSRDENGEYTSSFILEKVPFVSPENRGRANNVRLSTPPMTSEIMARAFSLVLFHYSRLAVDSIKI